MYLQLTWRFHKFNKKKIKQSAIINQVSSIDS